MTERGKNLLLAVTAVCLTLFAGEIALRLRHGVSPLDFSNFHRQRATRINENAVARYDPTLGWSLKDGVDRPGFHTLAQGIRRNSAEHTGLRRGSILAVGSSFTEGVQVNDEQTWPAQLERLIGRPVDNAGVRAYALDQIVLRAERLLPEARPRILLVGLMDTVVRWTGFATGGKPKPFFTVEDGGLVAHNIPVPSLAYEVDALAPVKAVLGYSHLIDRMMLRIDAEWWNAGRVSIRNDPMDVSCRLLQRLKQETDKFDVRTILVVESKAQDVISADVPPPSLQRVEECAKDMGYELVDGFAAFRADYKADPKRLNEYYAPTERGPIHFSELGNRRIAELVAAALAVEPPIAGQP